MGDRGVNVLDQSPYSPDINAAENTHRDVKSTTHYVFAVDIVELLAACKRSWAEYDEKYFQKTYISCYRRRLQAVIKNKGFPTKY